LLKNKFRFDLPFSEGISYLSRKEEGQIRASWAVRDAERAAIEDMTLKVDDMALVDHIHLSVRKWLSQPLVEREDYLNIPYTTQESPRIKHIPAALNRYQIRLTHQIIRNDYANLKTLGKDGFVRITIRNEKEDMEDKLRQERYREQDVVQAIEFRWLIEALCGGDISKIPGRCFLAVMPSDITPNDDAGPYRRFIDDLQKKLTTRRRVLFGHNCFTDLVYLYTCFIADPPETVEDFQELVHALFPAVVDTKYLASLVKELRFNSNLEALEKEMRREKLPIIEVPPTFDRYVWGERYHEAGFDSFMTANVAIKLSAKLEREGKHCDARKPQKIVKAGETILMDTTDDTEDEEQADEYVTASESAAEPESVMSALASKLSAVFSAPVKPATAISKPSAVRKLSKKGSLTKSDPKSDGLDAQALGQGQAETKHDPARHFNDDTISSNGDRESDTSTSRTRVVAVKEEKFERRNPTEIKRIKSSFAHTNLFDVLETSTGPNADGIPLAEKQRVTQSTSTRDEDTVEIEADLLVWSDREDQDDAEGEGADAVGGDAPIQPEMRQSPMTVEELQEKISSMAAEGAMMPRWESESGIWKVIGNKLVVNASEEGICIL
jgi:CAF1 family ribonuclease